jgi:hypothetical protein
MAVGHGTRLPASTPCIPFREKTDCGMTRTVPDHQVILDAGARFPDPTQPDHVAAVVRLDVVPDDARPQLADASRLTESLRRQGPTY